MNLNVSPGWLFLFTCHVEAMMKTGKSWKGRSVARSFGLSVLSAAMVVSAFTDSAYGSEVPLVAVEVESDQAKYLVGEPVRLRVRVTNTTGEPIRMREVIIEGIEPEIEIHLSRDGENFTRWMLEMFTYKYIFRDVCSLAPGETMEYALRLVYSRMHDRHLALPEPGQYWLKVRFPLNIEGPCPTVMIESNTVELHVGQPAGDELDAWRKIDAPAYLRFMQTGTATIETALEASAILKAEGQTRYAAGLQWALRQYYTQNRGKLSDAESKLLREAAGIELPRPRPFPEDTRLDQMVTFHLAKSTPLEAVLESLSEQTGVPLGLHPAIEGEMAAGRRVTQSLREFMRTRSISTETATKIREETGSYTAPRIWTRDGAGYRLEPGSTDE